MCEVLLEIENFPLCRCENLKGNAAWKKNARESGGGERCLLPLQSCWRFFPTRLGSLIRVPTYSYSRIQ